MNCHEPHGSDKKLLLSSANVWMEISQFSDGPYCQVAKVAPDIYTTWKGSMHCLANWLRSESNQLMSFWNPACKHQHPKTTMPKENMKQSDPMTIAPLPPAAHRGCPLPNKFTVASQATRNPPIAPGIPTVLWAHRAWYNSTEPGANNPGSTWVQLHFP